MKEVEKQDFNPFEMDDNAEELVFSCSICDADLNPFMEHFQGHVCKECMSEATDDDGRPIKFCADIEGGIEARYADNSEVYESEICYVHGIKCRAETEEMRNGYDVVGKIEKDASVIKFKNYARYQEKLSEIVEQVSDISDVIYDNLFSLACMGKWKEWDDQQPIGTELFVDEDMIRNTGDKNIDLLFGGSAHRRI